MGGGRGLHSSTFHLNLIRLVAPPRVPLFNRLGENLAPNVIPQNVLTLSRKVDECELLGGGTI